MIDWVEYLDKVFPERLSLEKPIMSLTDDWYRARRGRCTASKRAEIVAIGTPKQWAAMAAEIEYELCDNWKHEHFDNPAMAWGRNAEFQAIANAELEIGGETLEPGLVFHPEFSYAAATPDFFFGDDVTGQIKCPFNPTNHLKYVYGQTLTRTYHYQVQWEAWCSQRKKICFMSYDPRQPIETRCAVIWLDADMRIWKTFEDRLLEFKRKFESAAVKNPMTFKAHEGIPEIF